MLWIVAAAVAVPLRLALARVSVLRGSGLSAGTTFIDDYVANVEPVVDYLTRWSGIRPGGLGVCGSDSGSGHHLWSTPCRLVPEPCCPHTAACRGLLEPSSSTHIPVPLNVLKAAHPAALCLIHVAFV